MTASRNYPTPTVTWHGPVADGRNTWKVIVRHGCRVAHLDRLTEAQHDALVANPSLERPGREDYDGPARVNLLLDRMGLR